VFFFVLFRVQLAGVDHEDNLFFTARCQFKMQVRKDVCMDSSFLTAVGGPITQNQCNIPFTPAVIFDADRYNSNFTKTGINNQVSIVDATPAVARIVITRILALILEVSVFWVSFPGSGRIHYISKSLA
jgi:hypothetical protein